MTTMNTEDANNLTKYWSREADYVKEKIDGACKDAMNHAYALGLARGCATRNEIERLRKVMFDAWQDTDWLLIANEVYDMKPSNTPHERAAVLDLPAERSPRPFRSDC